MHTLHHTSQHHTRQGGHSSRHRPRFSGRNIRQARALARSRTARHALVQRARLALFVYDHPMATQQAAAQCVGQSVSWVQHWLRRWATEGFQLKDRPRSGRPPVYSPVERAMVIAVACELPAQRDLPLSRHFASSVHDVVKQEGSKMSLRTVQRILAADHLKPWRYRSWITPRDPEFQQKAEVILGLYEGVWQGCPLGPDDQVLCGDEKPSIQAREREVKPPKPGCPGHVESDYERRGALQYLAIWDVRRGIPWGRCERKNGIAAFDRLVDQVMRQEPYRSAPRVFLIVDNGTAHRGEKAVRRLQTRYPNLILVHLPVHASWLSQVEIYYSVIQRKVLTPAAAKNRFQLARRILKFEARCRRQPKPYQWKFTRQDFRKRLRQLTPSEAA